MLGCGWVGVLTTWTCDLFCKLVLRSAGTISASVSWYLDHTVAVFLQKKEKW